MNRNVKTLPLGVCVVGGTSTGATKRKGKQTTQPAATDHLTAQNVSFEGLNGAKCSKWWQGTRNNHLVKTSIRKARVEWVIQMLVFCIGDYERFLRTMIETYNWSLKLVRSPILDATL